MSGKREAVSALRAENWSCCAQIRSRAGKGVRGGEASAWASATTARCFVRGTGEELAVTTDLSISGRHFRLDWHPPESVGHRTLARGLSDLAAMGCSTGRGLSFARSLHANWWWRMGGRKSWVDRVSGRIFLPRRGKQDATCRGVTWPNHLWWLADIVLVGAVPRGKALLRSGARPGDPVYVTGRLGGAAAGLTKLAELDVADGRGEYGRVVRLPVGTASSASRGFNTVWPYAGEDWRRPLSTSATASPPILLISAKNRA